MVQFADIMTTTNSTPHYALGSTDAEQERLIRQAALLAPFTERFFLGAGIGPGQRVLDIGSGVGDVAMLVAKLVNPSGEVVGVERDARSIARARARVSEAGLHNVTFTQSDVSQIPSSKPFDAVVGRFILMFLPDPVAVSLVHETFRRSGANTEMGFALYQIFQEAGLPAPTVNLEMPLGNDPEFIRWVPDVLGSLLPQVQQFNLPLEPLGDLATLPQRLQAEIAAANTVVTWMAMVGAWSRKPANQASH